MGWEFDTWGNLPKHCRIKTTWALAYRRNWGPPVLLETLALYSYMTFENAKVSKLEKEYFFQIELTAIEFWVQKQMRTKSKIASPWNKTLKTVFFLVFAAVNKSIMSVKSILWTISNLAHCSEGPSCTFSPVPRKNARQI